MKFAAFACLCTLSIATEAAALGVDVKDLHAAAAEVTTSIELRDVLPDRSVRRSIKAASCISAFMQRCGRSGRSGIAWSIRRWCVCSGWLGRRPDREFAVYEPEGGFSSIRPFPIRCALRFASAAPTG